MRTESTVATNPNIFLRETSENEFLVMDTGTGRIHKANQISALIIRLCENGMKVQDLVDLLKVGNEKVRAEDIVAHLDLLKGKGVVLEKEG